jgi:hypothetical protein
LSKTVADLNSTQWALFRRLKETELPVLTGSGGLAKFKRRYNNVSMVLSDVLPRYTASVNGRQESHIKLDLK